MGARSFSLVNLGCKVNRVEADSIGAALLALGWVSRTEGADVAIVNTCTVTAEADRKTRKEVNRALVRNPGAVVLVTGCAAAIDPSFYEALSPAVRVVEKAHVVGECLAVGKQAGSGLPQEFSGLPPVGALQDCGRASLCLRVGDGFPTRVGVKVQDGCDNACTFCIVHVARGKAASVPLHLLVEEVSSYAQAGVREVVLTGIDLGAYKDSGVGLSGLVRALREAAPETRLRISSIEPHSLDGELVELLASENGMVCRHLHIPLQSGSTRVLRQMARRYSAEDYMQSVHSLRKAIPQISLSTDVIVGFPGETEADFQETLGVAASCGFSRMHLFRYSMRAGTPAAQRPDQIPPEQKAERMRRLEKLAAALRADDARKRLGETELVLVESNTTGTSESYYDVAVPEGAKQGSLVPLVLSSFDKDVFSSR